MKLYGRVKKQTLSQNFLQKSSKVFLQYCNEGQYQNALTLVENLIFQGLKTEKAFSDASVAAIYCQNWNKAISYGEKAIALNPDNLSALDALSHAYGAIRDWKKTKKYGSKALDCREKLTHSFEKSNHPIYEKTVFSKKKVIAFSLFGSNPKYCETAVLNCVAQPRIYPGWECWFYIDDTVPENIVARLKAKNARVFKVTKEIQKWPGPMWRFAAYDHAAADIVIFRDTDSVISEKEAAAVQQWEVSHKKFHFMRDWGTHTELILAGMWGIKKGGLPRMEHLISDFLKKPIKSQHFADQFFLREYVWKFAQENHVTHDSIFDWNGAQKFPIEATREDFHIGCVETAQKIHIAFDKPDGTLCNWRIMSNKGEESEQICEYNSTIMDGGVLVNIPDSYREKIIAGQYIVESSLFSHLDE